jgi:hypothetical protein
VTPATKIIYCETPTNPMMFLTDLAAVADLAQSRGIVTVVDNTFATPFFQQPLRLGCDVVLHSTTKYLNGHSDMVGGVLVTDRDDLAERLGFLQNSCGAIPGPFDCWLACGVPRPCRCGCASTTPAAASSRGGSRRIPRSSGCITRVWRPIRSTPSPAAR